MNKSYSAWATWSIAIFLVWAIILLIKWKIKSGPDIKVFLLVFAGYFIGWLSATIKFILIISKLN